MSEGILCQSSIALSMMERLSVEPFFASLPWLFYESPFGGVWVVSEQVSTCVSKPATQGLRHRHSHAISYDLSYARLSSECHSSNVSRALSSNLGRQGTEISSVCFIFVICALPLSIDVRSSPTILVSTTLR